MAGDWGEPHRVWWEEVRNQLEGLLPKTLALMLYKSPRVYDVRVEVRSMRAMVPAEVKK